jgi:hypothetical protein
MHQIMRPPIEAALLNSGIRRAHRAMRVATAQLRRHTAVTSFEPSRPIRSPRSARVSLWNGQTNNLGGLKFAQGVHFFLACAFLYALTAFRLAIRSRAGVDLVFSARL